VGAGSTLSSVSLQTSCWAGVVVVVVVVVNIIMDTPAEANAAIRSKYSKLAKVGEGTYASVFLARDTTNGTKVAIKKIKVVSTSDGMDISAIREVKVLRELRHPNVICLVDCFSSGSTTQSLNMVLEFLDTDLERLIKDKSIVFTPADIKGWMAMLLRGLEYCHRHFILHRDLKPNNLLISPDGELKIADFGMARELADPGIRMTSLVVTLWYRPPELLLGARHYSPAVDMWSVGCIMAELLLRVPFLPGQSDLDQLTTIFRALGTPTEKEWPGHKSLPNAMQFEQHPRPPFSSIFPAASADTADLLGKLLLFDAAKRATAHDSLHHPYLRTAPRPTHFTKLPRHASKEIEADSQHPLLSDSEVKDKNRLASSTASGRANAARLTGSGAAAKAIPFKRRGLAEVSPGTVAKRKLLARKLAFAN
jgi:cyclin-dependent kinase 7